MRSTRDTTAASVVCPRCDLRLPRAVWARTLEPCPRCMGLAGIAVGMVVDEIVSEGGCEIRCGSEAGWIRVAVRGDLDLATAPMLDREMRRIEASRPPRMLLDLGRTTFMDARGLQPILDAQGRARQEGRALALRPGPERVQRVFELCGVLDSLDVLTGPLSSTGLIPVLAPVSGAEIIASARR